MRLGKLTNSELKECVLDIIKRRRSEVLVSSSLAQDCASFVIGDTILITTDPITGVDTGAGELAIKINVNDISAAGGVAVLAVLNVLVPPNASVEDIKNIMLAAESEAEKANIEIIGGHTEFTDAVTRIIVSATVVGRTKKHIASTTAKAGDKIIITKTIGIEGTAILAADYDSKIKDYLSEKEIEEAKALKNDISITKEAGIAKRYDISAMHDITEGGVFGAVAEMAEAAGLGAKITVKDIPIEPVTKKLCASLEVDPYRLISSGSLIISTSDGIGLIKALKAGGISATEIGEFTVNKEIYADYGDRIEYLEVKSDQLLEARKRY